jgi:hypothetical protein
MAHHLNAHILKEFAKVQECRQFGFDVKLLYDNSRKDFPYTRFHDASDYTLFTRATIRETYSLVPYWKEKRNPLYGNLLYPVLLFALQQAYEYVWRIEFDVRYSGRWPDFFNAFAASPADLLGTTLCRYAAAPDWSWWSTATVNDVPIDQSLLIRGFYPVIRLSRNACTMLDRAYRQGWQGHFEVMVGTILNHYGCRLEDIGGWGEFVRAEHRGRFYSNTPQTSNMWPGTFVWRWPDACLEHRFDIPDYLYHPVVRKSVYLQIYCLLRLLPSWIWRPIVTLAKRFFRLKIAE